MANPTVHSDDYAMTTVHTNTEPALPYLHNDVPEAADHSVAEPTVPYIPNDHISLHDQLNSAFEAADQSVKEDERLHNLLIELDKYF